MKKIILFTLLSLNQLNAQTLMNIHQNNGTTIQLPLNTIDSITYTTSNPGNLASITTIPSWSVLESSALSGGVISNNGGSPVTSRGLAWSKNQNPTTADSITTDGSGIGEFIRGLFSLSPNTTYYVRAYAINSAGTAYGNEISFTTTPILVIESNPGTGVTFDGYTYSSIILGNGQEWMAENLRTSIYANGDTIPNIIDNSEWVNLTSGAWAFYNNDTTNLDMNGKLYNWYTISDPRKVCPIGWRVSTESDWETLVNYLGGIAEAGGKLKSLDTNYWDSPNTGASNISGFNGLGSGHRIVSGNLVAFTSKNQGAIWWSPSDNTIFDSWHYSVGHSYKGIAYTEVFKNYGISIRCVKE